MSYFQDGTTSEKKIYTVGISWEMYGYDEVEADSLEEAIKIVEDPRSGRILPNGSYVEDSYKIDYDATEDMNE